jgi:hypothetical protein
MEQETISSSFKYLGEYIIQLNRYVTI